VVSVLITIRESVDMGVVNERVITISPGKLLGPDAKMVIGDKWRGLVLGGVRGDECSHVGEHDDRASHEEEAGPPSLPVSVSVGPGHLPDLSHVGLPQQTQASSSHILLASSSWLVREIFTFWSMEMLFRSSSRRV